MSALCCETENIHQSWLKFLQQRKITLFYKQLSWLKAAFYIFIAWSISSAFQHYFYRKAKYSTFRIDAFELWCWRRLLRVPWTARRSNQSILKISPGVHWKDWCWNWNSSTLAIWCEELTHWKRPSCWEGLGTGGDGDTRG